METIDSEAVDVVTVAEVEVEEESSPSATPLPMSQKKNAKSSVWKHFLIYNAKKEIANCQLCNGDIKYPGFSTTILMRHLKTYHREDYNKLIADEVNASIAKAAGETKRQQKDITAFVKFSPTFERHFILWMIDTYQPISTSESDSIRKMCLALNPKHSFLGTFLRCVLLLLLYSCCSECFRFFLFFIFRT
jgi:hypothetical protein